MVGMGHELYTVCIQYVTFDACSKSTVTPATSKVTNIILLYFVHYMYYLLHFCDLH